MRGRKFIFSGTMYRQGQSGGRHKQKSVNTTPQRGTSTSLTVAIPVTDAGIKDPIKHPDQKLEEKETQNEGMTDLHATCVVIIGKTGSGKSTLGNILLGKKQFAVGKEIPSTSADAVCVGSGASLPKARRVANSTALSLVQSQGSSSVRLNSSTIHRQKEKSTNDTKEKELLSNVGSPRKEGKTSKGPTMGVHTHRTSPKEITSGSIEPARQPIQEKKVSTPQTTQAQVALRERPSHTIKVLDTPDVTVRGMTDSDIDQEVKKWKSLASPSPDAFLLTVRADVRHAVEDLLLYQKVKEVWGDASEFRKKLIVAFTFADNLTNPDEDLRERAPEIRMLLEDANGRHILISDKNHMMAKEAAERVINFVTGKAKTFGKKLTLTCKAPSAIQEDACSAHDEKEETFDKMSTLTCEAPSAIQEDAHNAHDDEQDIVRRGASPMCQSSSNERRVLIIGKKNSGKRSLSKLLDGKIQPDAGTDIPTKGIWDKTKRDTAVLRVVETPDVMDDKMSEEDMRQQICCLKEEMSSSPDVIMYAVRCDPRHTVEDINMCQRIKNLWGEASDFHQKLVVAFIFAESLDEPQHVLSESQPEIQKLLEDVNGRYILISDNDIATVETVSDRMLSLITGKTQPATTHCPPASKEYAERKEFQVEQAVHERRTSAQDKRQPDERRILIIGKTGNGRSTLGNLLLGTEQFVVATGMSAATTQVQTGRRAAGEGTSLKVVDTPDLINQEMGEADMRCHVNQWKTETLSNPDAILLAVRCDIRYTSEEFKLYQKIKELWGDASQFCQKLIVAFTFGETLDEDIQEVLKYVGPEIRRVLEDAGNRFVVFSKDDPQMTETAISKVLRFRGGEQAAYESAQDKRQPDERRILIIGKTGNGRSTLGNLLLGTEQFVVATGMSAATTQVQTGRRAAREGTALKVVDTPDLIDQEMSEADMRFQVKQWKTETLSNPDVIMVAVRCDGRYTSEEFKLYQKIKELWGDASQFCQKLIVAFTFGETLDEDIQEVLKDVGPEIRRVLEDAGNRFVVFSKDDPQMTETAISKVLRFRGANTALDGTEEGNTSGTYQDTSVINSRQRQETHQIQN
ncbi:GTPase IMAP family member 8-like isoform X2 [Littorina saxatilis]